MKISESYFTENSKKYIFETLKTKKSNTIVISPGIEPKLETKNRISYHSKKLIYLSNFIEGKGYFKLINAVQNLEITVDCYGEILSDNYYRTFRQKQIPLISKEKFPHK